MNFFLVMAVVALTAANALGTKTVWTPDLVESALVEPMKLTLATLVCFLERFVRC